MLIVVILLEFASKRSYPYITMYRTRSFRRHKGSCIIAKRLKFLKRVGSKEWVEQVQKQKHRLSKRHPMDCGQSKCRVCHYEKVFGIEKAKYKLWRQNEAES